MKKKVNVTCGELVAKLKRVTNNPTPWRAYEMDFISYVKGHGLWDTIKGDIALMEFIEHELASAVVHSSLLSKDLDAIPMDIVLQYVRDVFYNGGRAIDHRDYRAFRNRITNLIRRAHDTLDVQTRTFGGKRYSCLVVVGEGQKRRR